MKAKTRIKNVSVEVYGLKAEKPICKYREPSWWLVSVEVYGLKADKPICKYRESSWWFKWIIQH